MRKKPMRTPTLVLSLAAFSCAAALLLASAAHEPSFGDERTNFDAALKAAEANRAKIGRAHV